MIRPTTVNIEKDGPRLALKRMRENEVSTVYIVNNKRELVGIIDARYVLELVRKESRDLQSVVNANVPTTTEETPIADILDDISKPGFHLPS